MRKAKEPKGEAINQHKLMAMGRPIPHGQAGTLGPDNQKPKKPVKSA